MEKFEHRGFEGFVRQTDGRWYANVDGLIGVSYGSGKTKDVAIRQAKRNFDKNYYRALEESRRR